MRGQGPLGGFSRHRFRSRYCTGGAGHRGHVAGRADLSSTVDREPVAVSGDTGGVAGGRAGGLPHRLGDPGRRSPGHRLGRDCRFSHHHGGGTGPLGVAGRRFSVVSPIRHLETFSHPPGAGPLARRPRHHVRRRPGRRLRLAVSAGADPVVRAVRLDPAGGIAGC